MSAHHQRVDLVLPDGTQRFFRLGKPETKVGDEKIFL